MSLEDSVLSEILTNLIRPFAETLSRHPPESIKVRTDGGPSHDINHNRMTPDDMYVEMTLRVDCGDLKLRIMIRGDTLGYRIKTATDMPLDEKTWPISDPECIEKVRKTLNQFMGYWYYNTIKSLEMRTALTRDYIKAFEEITS